MTYRYDPMPKGGPDGLPTTRGQEMTVVLLAYNCAHRIVPIVERLLALLPDGLTSSRHGYGGLSWS